MTTEETTMTTEETTNQDVVDKAKAVVGALVSMFDECTQSELAALHKHHAEAVERQDYATALAAIDYAGRLRQRGLEAAVRSQVMVARMMNDAVAGTGQPDGAPDQA